jgi:hypothetical protein
MKILTILYILLQINTFNYGNYSSANSNNRYSGSNVPVEQTYRGIGYTTNYSNGQFNSGVYKSSMTTLGYQNRAFAGTYNPAESSSGGERTGGGPRRITVYDGNGNTAETPGDVGDPEGIYQYDESTGKWYYSPDNGKTWYEWRRASGIWELFVGLFGGGWGSDWRTVNNPPSENSNHWASDPNDPFLTPIGDAIIPLLILLHLYIGYDVFKKNS